MCEQCEKRLNEAVKKAKKAKPELKYIIEDITGKDPWQEFEVRVESHIKDEPTYYAATSYFHTMLVKEHDVYVANMLCHFLEDMAPIIINSVQDGKSPAEKVGGIWYRRKPDDTD